MRRMYRFGFLDETQNKLDYVLALNPTDVLERRLQVSMGSLLRCRDVGRHSLGWGSARGVAL